MGGRGKDKHGNGEWNEIKGQTKTKCIRLFQMWLINAECLEGEGQDLIKNAAQKEEMRLMFKRSMTKGEYYTRMQRERVEDLTTSILKDFPLKRRPCLSSFELPIFFLCFKYKSHGKGTIQKSHKIFMFISTVHFHNAFILKYTINIWG